MDKFGDKISYLRKKYQKTQEEIADAVGTTKSTISKYERNLVEPTLESAKNLANYFMVSLDWLSENKGIKTINNDEDNIEINIPQSYIEIIKKAISQDISADNLNDVITFISKIKNKK